MSSVTSSITELFNSVLSIFVGLLHSILAVFQAVLGLGQNVVKSVVNLAEALTKAILGVVGGTVGIVWGNLFVIGLLGGGYYLYTVNSRQRSGKKKKA